MKLDKKFIGYFKEKREVAVVAVILALGLILLFLGGRSDKSEEITDVSLEDRIAAACSAVEGVGECKVYVYLSAEDEDATVESVIVICEGADSVDVRLRLTEMLSSFFGIGRNRVRVEKLNK